MAYFILTDGYKCLRLVNKARPWWIEEDSSRPGSYVLYLIGLGVGFHSLVVSHTDEKLLLLFFDNSAVGIDR